MFMCMNVDTDLIMRQCCASLTSEYVTRQCRAAILYVFVGAKGQHAIVAHC